MQVYTIPSLTCNTVYITKLVTLTSKKPSPSRVFLFVCYDTRKSLLDLVEFFVLLRVFHFWFTFIRRKSKATVKKYGMNVRISTFQSGNNQGEAKRTSCLNTSLLHVSFLESATTARLTPTIAMKKKTRSFVRNVLRNHSHSL